jgi:hypothetical protein
MHSRIRSFHLLLVVCLTVALILGFAYFAPGRKLHTTSAQGVALTGPYGIVGSDSSGSGILILMTFDGAGGVTGSFTSASRDSGQGRRPSAHPDPDRDISGNLHREHQ